MRPATRGASSAAATQQTGARRFFRSYSSEHIAKACMEKGRREEVIVAAKACKQN